MSKVSVAKVLCAKVLGLAVIGIVAQGVPAAHSNGIEQKQPVFGGACKLCPWGAMAHVVKDSMQFYGYDVRICYNCNATDSTRIVSQARVPPPYKRDEHVSDVIAPPNAPGLGPVDFGATAEQFLCDAYHARGAYATDKPMTNLRLIANIQSPWWLVVAARSGTGITDLSQLKARQGKVRIYAPPNDWMLKDILAYYGMSVDSIKAAGGEIGTSQADREGFDIIVYGGAMSTAPEWNVLNEVSQQFKLNYLELPEPLLAKMAETPLVYRGYMPVGFLRGVERQIPTLVRNGTVVYTRDDVPDSFAYDVARAMDQHQDELQWTNQNFSYNVHNVWKVCDVPLHPGALRYYREMGYAK